ncbi:MAG: hypothetical protein Q9190_004910 [Brigantiaea leucoxantha]
MPKERKKRGRREEKKRKIEQEEQEKEGAQLKRRRVDPRDESKHQGTGDSALHGANSYFQQGPGELPFYGLLDDQEQEYFKRAESILELDQFENIEERDIFLANVYKEASGKELKIANSQSCSRLMERLIALSSPSQIKKLFQKFNGHFLHLAQHRFASHCCEALFLRAAPIVSQELLASTEEQQHDMTNEEIYVSMENLFLHTLTELEEALGYLITNTHASHTIRVLLVVLSGRPLASVETAAILRSKKKEHISHFAHKDMFLEGINESRAVPESFQTALQRIISGIVTGLDTTYLRAMACHPVANPLIQLLLELELSQSGRAKAHDNQSLFRKLLPDDPPEQGTESASFFNSLLYEVVGSRLLETVVKLAPGKDFKAIYRNLILDKLPSLARNETASYVLIKVLERLSKEDLEEAVARVCPQIGPLIENSRTIVIKVLIERCRVRKANTDSLATAIEQAYSQEPHKRLCRLLGLESAGSDVMSADRKRQLDSQDAGRAHGSLLAQSMLDGADKLRDLILDGILGLDIPMLIATAKDRTATHTLQKSLFCNDNDLKFRRTLAPRFLGSLTILSTDPVASHVIDSLWRGTDGLKFIREKMAEELFQNEATLRETLSGRAVWRNWKMDMYRTRKTEWLSEAKSQTSENQSGIEVARLRHAKTISRKKAKDRGHSRTVVAKQRESGAPEVILAGQG